MGHHINDKGEFQSDKYPELGPDKLVLSFRDKGARRALAAVAATYPDRELADDVLTRLVSISLEETG